MTGVVLPFDGGQVPDITQADAGLLARQLRHGFLGE